MRISYRIPWLIIRVFGWLLFGYKVYGVEKIPKTGKVILAANHRENNDPPLLGAILSREVYYLAKSELFDMPIIGVLVRRFNCIPVKRKGRDVDALRSAVRILNQNHGVIIFPEGTRSRTDHFLRATPGVGFIAAQTDAPVYPIYMDNTKLGFKRIIFRKAIRIRVGDPLLFSDFASHRSEDKREIYRFFAQKVMDEIAAIKASIQ
jgi:1-acyl-sn-glycerol-3-phosphate acyltransferase